MTTKAPIRILTDHEWYQSVPSSYTVALFGQVGPGRGPTAQRLFFGKRAYEAGQMLDYVREYLEIVERRDAPSLTRLTPLPIFAYALLCALQRRGRAELCELGSTLYSIRDRIEVYEESYGLGVQLSELECVGIEPSDIFIGLAEHLHPAASIRHYQAWHQVQAAICTRISVALGTPGYAFTSTDEFADWLRTSRVSICMTLFSKGGDVGTSAMLGKRFPIFDLRRLIDTMRSAGFSVCALGPAQARVIDDVEHLEFSFVVHDLSSDEQQAYDEIQGKLPVPFLLNLHESVDLDQVLETVTRNDYQPHVSTLGIKPHEVLEMHGSEFHFNEFRLYLELVQHIAETGFDGNRVDMLSPADLGRHCNRPEVSALVTSGLDTRSMLLLRTSPDGRFIVAFFIVDRAEARVRHFHVWSARELSRDLQGFLDENVIVDLRAHDTR